jgi:hypothetical protein
MRVQGRNEVLFEKGYISRGEGFWREEVSYDFGIKENLNITFNMSGFLNEFLEIELTAPHWEDSVKETGMDALSGKKGFEAIPILREFFKRCYNYRGDLAKDYDSPNGWGTVQSCMVNLALLMADCIANPFDEIWVHR